MLPAGAAYSLSAACGLLCATAELLSRYRDGPHRLFRLKSSWIYAVINAGLSAGALLIVRGMDLRTHDSPNGFGPTTQVLVAGFGAMLLLRSSIALIAVGDTALGAGPALVVTSLLGAIDNVIDRNQARRRSQDAAKIMSTVGFSRACDPLPEHCLLLRDHATQQEIDTLVESVDQLIERAEEGADDHALSLDLGVVLIKFVGQEVLADAVIGLADSIKRLPQP